MEFFKPDYYFEHYSDISAEWLKKNNIKVILSDIDSTLAPHDKLGDKHLVEWLKGIKENRIDVICISNNSEKRASDFSRAHDIRAIGQCSKPNTRKIEEFIRREGINKENTLILGDQLFTDVWVGKRLKIKTILVKPLGEHQPLGIKLKRIIENAWIKKWELHKN